jgi:tRNA threonylcarbamoyladenosine modification (KEOPS) complex Cgi121 subunit
MMVQRISVNAPKNQIIDAATSNGVLLLNPKNVDSLQSLRLAHHLANSTFEQKTNIASKFHLEFLLWLSGKKDIRSALDGMLFDAGRDIIAVCFDAEAFDKFMKETGAKALALKLKENSDAMELERISLSRI